MKAFLGTGSYVPPQWLAAGHPEILVQLHPGVKAHPMARHAPCLNHPLYPQRASRLHLALGREFKDHPTVVAGSWGTRWKTSSRASATTRRASEPGSVAEEDLSHARRIQPAPEPGELGDERAVSR